MQRALKNQGIIRKQPFVIQLNNCTFAARLAGLGNLIDKNNSSGYIELQDCFGQ